MKKIFSIIGFVTLVCLSFIYTERASNLANSKDELMMTIKQLSSKYEIKSVDAIIDNDTFIPGINGTKVDCNKSYRAMKKYGVFNESLLEYKQIKPNDIIADNYDKYIISGNPEKNMVSLIIFVDSNTSVENIIKIADEKKVKLNLFVDSTWFKENNHLIEKYISNGHIIGNLSYNLDYNDGAYIYMDTIIKKIGKQKIGYCYADDENIQNLKICSMNKNYTIKPDSLIKDNYLTNIKSNLKSGSIISLKLSDNLNKELLVIINYINSKGFSIVNLDTLLFENRSL